MSYGSRGGAARTICSALPDPTSAPGSPSAFTFSRTVRTARASASTSRTCPAPRDRASRPTAPEPAYRSRTRSPSSGPPSRDCQVEKRPSRARSEVGRVPCPGGTARRRPPAAPAITRVMSSVLVGVCWSVADPSLSALLQVLLPFLVQQGVQRRAQGGQVRQVRVGGHHRRRLLPRLGDDLLV